MSIRPQGQTPVPYPDIDLSLAPPAAPSPSDEFRRVLAMVIRGRRPQRQPSPVLDLDLALAPPAAPFPSSPPQGNAVAGELQVFGAAGGGAAAARREGAAADGDGHASLENNGHAYAGPCRGDQVAPPAGARGRVPVHPLKRAQMAMPPADAGGLLPLRPPSQITPSECRQARRRRSGRGAAEPEAEQVESVEI
ncbi:uncharacterized protein LOC104584316 isoform X3 [Brachypodium distachyon]|uniref:uncharacterized protein LOC104584316 isoform X3 n=1 Tax=Brachypodium distachyon TaxID=15368 RepID=UPI00052FE202|nr:uncharacterized protein LOC104584316 isoform X3 [Brachypodium distachyon]|eukprot:XP_010236893.1 uncharacterized protein LOC104584316 isoform X3 [Brachypodium distachyon]